MAKKEEKRKGLDYCGVWRREGGVGAVGGNISLRSDAMKGGGGERFTHLFTADVGERARPTYPGSRSCG